MVFMVCMKLHNLCIDQNVEMPIVDFSLMFDRVMSGGLMIMLMKMIFFFMAEQPVIANVT
jgi:hypothetical protein